MPGTDVPVEAVRAAANALLGTVSSATAHTVARRVFDAAAEAGYVLAPGPGDLGQGARLIGRERLRQVVEEEYFANHDARHTRGELVQAAIWYADETASVMDWPWGEFPKPKGEDRIRDLTKAGALIAAEIDRLAAARPVGLVVAR